MTQSDEEYVDERSHPEANSSSTYDDTVEKSARSSTSSSPPRTGSRVNKMASTSRPSDNSGGQKRPKRDAPNSDDGELESANAVSSTSKRVKAADESPSGNTGIEQVDQLAPPLPARDESFIIDPSAPGISSQAKCPVRIAIGLHHSISIAFPDLYSKWIKCKPSKYQFLAFLKEQAEEDYTDGRASLIEYTLDDPRFHSPEGIVDFVEEWAKEAADQTGSSTIAGQLRWMTDNSMDPLNPTTYRKIMPWSMTFSADVSADICFTSYSTLIAY
jgi:hypothetical protein